MKTSLAPLAGAALLCCLATARAQTAAAAATTPPAAPPVVTAASAVEQIVIKGQSLQTQATPYSSTVLDSQQIRDALITQPEELLRLVPGVVVRALSLGGVVNTISIRGFSSGAHGGDLGMVVDGIPLNEAMSHADGYSDLNIVVPLEIARFEVFRGPVSALYGNFNRGGVLAITTRRGGEYAAVDLSGGSFGTVDVQGAMGAKLGPGRFNGAFQGYKTDGFRPGFDYRRGTLAGRWSVDLGPRTELSLSARGHRGDWDSVGNVTKAQFERVGGADPYAQDPRVVADGGLKRYGSARVDLNQTLTENLKLLTFAYGNQQDYTRFFTRPISATAWSQREETYDRKVGGAGFSFNGSNTLLGGPFNWVAGAEAYRERTDYLYHEGTIARRRVNAPGYDRTYDFDSVSAFTEMEATISPLLRPTLGLRWDRFTGNCERIGPETGTDACARLNTASRATPKVGIRSTVAPGLDLRGSYAEGFALPPNAVKYAPGGASLAPTIFKQTELGLSYAQGGWLRSDVAVFRIGSSNEVRTLTPGVFENFGRTQRNGVDASVTLTALTALELGLVYNAVDAKVKENASPALVGKLITGVHKEAATVSLAWRPAEGFGGNVEVRKIGAVPVLADNSVFYPGYTTVDLGVQYTGGWGGTASATRYRVYAKVENATDKLYATSTGITSGVQTYNVAPPRGVRVGVQADF